MARRTKQGGHDVHGAPLGAAEIAAARERLGWSHAPFEVPEDVYAAFAKVAARGASARAAWAARLDSSPHRAAFLAAQAGEAPGLAAAMADYKAGLLRDRPKVATRKASEMALEVVNAAVPFTVGGSADLTGSNLTRSKGMRPVTRDDFGGSYIHYGIREHGMAAAMNGIALHGGFRPYGGTFLAFADYARPAIRLAALMRVPTVFVMTHDSIGLGEDGPTHQPVEHLASLRAIPNLTVIRPADAVETAEAWEIAMAATDGPVLLVLSRQNLPTVRDDADGEPGGGGGLPAARSGRAARDADRDRVGGGDRAGGGRRADRRRDRGGGGVGAVASSASRRGRRRSGRRCSGPRRGSGSRRRSGRGGTCCCGRATASSG